MAFTLEIGPALYRLLRWWWVLPLVWLVREYWIVASMRGRK